MIDALSNKLTDMIRSNSKDISDEKAEIIQYGLNLVIFEFLLLTAIVIVSIFSGMLGRVALTAALYGVLRVFAGGAHSQTRLQCSILYITTLFGIPILSKYMWADSYLHAILLLGISIPIVCKYAPGDTEEKPIISKKIIKRQKYVSLFLISAIYLFAIFIWHYSKIHFNILILTAVSVLFLIIPPGYKILKCKHSEI